MIPGSFNEYARTLNTLDDMTINDLQNGRKSNRC